jgi:hypothetical protein
MTEKVSLEVAIEVVLRNNPNFETIAGLCKMAVEAEREACAKHFDGSDYMMYRSEVAAAIRARGQA